MTVITLHCIDHDTITRIVLAWLLSRIDRLFYDRNDVHASLPSVSELGLR